jgi:osmotically-inducible protein OsmY
MKKVIILCAIMITSSILSSCAPIVQGAAAVTTVATMSNDRRTMGEILDDKTLYIDLGNLVIKIQCLKMLILTLMSITRLY